jgi:hypothetical protein
MGAIYLQADASDLLCDRSREWVQCVMRQWKRTNWRRREMIGVELESPEHGVTMISAVGEISPHDDKGFPRHSLLWVLRGSGAAVTDANLAGAPQPVGTIIAFDCHQTHALVYPENPNLRPRLWCALNVDADEPWTEGAARAAISKALGRGDGTGRDPSPLRETREAI